MRIHIIAVGTRMPAWVAQGYEEYARRMPPECTLNLVEIPAEKRGKGTSVAQVLHKEADKVLAALPKHARVVALDVRGKSWSTEELARELDAWLHGGGDVALLVGGPEGFDARVLERAATRWSLSRLTFPHPLVRVILAEQLYRAWTVLKKHPYHRE